MQLQYTSVINTVKTFFSLLKVHTKLFYCDGDRLIIVGEVDLTDAPVGLDDDLVGEVHGVGDKDDAQEGHHDVDGDVDVRALLDDGVHDVRALECLLWTPRDGEIVCTQLGTVLKVRVQSSTNNGTIWRTGLKTTRRRIK